MVRKGDTGQRGRYRVRNGETTEGRERWDDGGSDGVTE